MTWTKTGVEYPADCSKVELSDAAYRTHNEVIHWLYETETNDCKVPKHRARRVAESPHAESAFRELVAVGFWQDCDTYYQVVHHADVIRQSLAAQVGKRVRDKRAQQNHRKKGSVSADVSADVIPDTDRQTSRHVGGDDLQGCEHDTWGCLDCKRKARESA